MKLVPLAFAALAWSAPSLADNVSQIEQLYELARVRCDWAKKCVAADVKKECDMAVPQMKKAWDQAKAKGDVGKVDLDRDDWQRCVAVFLGSDCAKYPRGLGQFLMAKDGVPGCKGYVDYQKQAGKYAKKR